MTMNENRHPTQTYNVGTDLNSIGSTIVGGVQYIGFADPGVLESQTGWKIIKITTSGDEYNVKHANGNARFINIWDDRAGYTYS